ncbi:MAG: TonB-dependent receptor [Paludibacteraceae bacterium]|nr:TonB-dependent receptor [Paludibacteraceae bacterium]MBQ6764320.1 TonB-dependent receptor [Paludibacteraceae bacterium]
MNRLITVLFAIFSAALVTAQTQVSGVVIDAKTGEPVIGASVLIQGTTVGTVTDYDGKFLLDVPDKKSLLEVSYLGYVSQTLAASDAQRVLLKEDTQALEEVVVVGYGTQKKSVVTAAISKVTAEDLENIVPTRIDNMLKGKASGVTITSSSGQPGAGARVNIRGIGTINDASPLYVVDGMPMGNIDYLNPTDIESIEVLKDAASAAIYGTKGANGVVLVTTKNGAFGKKVSISYDMNIGWQNPWKQKAVLNAPWYQTILNEARINDGSTPYFATITTDPGTNWQDALFNYNAPVQSHQVSVNGGGEKVTYFVSFGFLDQQGIVGGNFKRSNYTRYSVRDNNVYKIIDTDTRKWLNHLTLTSNISYSNVASTGIAENSAFYSPLGSALLIAPTQPLYADDPQSVLDKYPTAIRDKEGKVYSVPDITMSEVINPVASLELPAGWNRSDRFTGNLTAELEIYDGLKFKSSFNTDFNFGRYDGYGYPYYLSSGGAGSAVNSSVSSSQSRTFTWQVENVLSYNHEFSGHEIGVLLGQSATKTAYSYVSGTAYDLPSNDPYKATIDYAQGSVNDMRTSGGRSYSAGASYFARVNYNYKERYIFQGSLRCDGSDKFGSNNRWGLFPSFSLGWNIAREAFWENVPDAFSAFKIRASWGLNGNDRISDFAYTSLIVSGSNYTFGRLDNEAIITGVRQGRLANADLKWETSRQTDIGLELGFLSNALTLNLDYFHKTTVDMLMPALLPSYVGIEQPWTNGGKMLNWGIEADLSYKFRVSSVNFALAGNITYLRNRLIDYGNETGSSNLDNVQGVGVVSRAQNGEVYPFFYGYKTAGIFQTQAEVDAYVNDKGELLQPNAHPGDVRFVDYNGDGKINDDDRTKIGKGMPDITYSFSLNIEWQGLDLNLFFQGIGGNQVFDATRRPDLSLANQPAWILNRWTGPNTSNTIPRVTEQDPNDNWRSSDLYIKPGSYLRLKSLQLGYSLPKKWMQTIHFQKIRVYFSAENLLTFTAYDGYDPEIGSGGTSIGIDAGCYPQSRTLSVGANIVF